MFHLPESCESHDSIVYPPRLLCTKFVTPHTEMLNCGSFFVLPDSGALQRLSWSYVCKMRNLLVSVCVFLLWGFFFNIILQVTRNIAARKWMRASKVDVFGGIDITKVFFFFFRPFDKGSPLLPSRPLCSIFGSLKPANEGSCPEQQATKRCKYYQFTALWRWSVIELIPFWSAMFKVLSSEIIRPFETTPLFSAFIYRLSDCNAGTRRLIF